jgi:hypothetical protein
VAPEVFPEVFPEEAFHEAFPEVSVGKNDGNLGVSGTGSEFREARSSSAPLPRLTLPMLSRSTSMLGDVLLFVVPGDGCVAYGSNASVRNVVRASVPRAVPRGELPGLAPPRGFEPRPRRLSLVFPRPPPLDPPDPTAKDKFDIPASIFSVWLDEAVAPAAARGTGENGGGGVGGDTGSGGGAPVSS